jgi:hypothetical protein
VLLVVLLVVVEPSVESLVELLDELGGPDDELILLALPEGKRSSVGSTPLGRRLASVAMADRARIVRRGIFMLARVSLLLSWDQCTGGLFYEPSCEYAHPARQLVDVDNSSRSKNFLLGRAHISPLGWLGAVVANAKIACRSFRDTDRRDLAT